MHRAAVGIVGRVGDQLVIRGQRQRLGERVGGGLGQVLVQSGRRAEAEPLFDAASQLCRSMGLVLPEIHPDRLPHLNSSYIGLASF